MTHTDIKAGTKGENKARKEDEVASDEDITS
jgi:hypothetical protein